MSTLQQDLRLLDAFERAAPTPTPQSLGERLRKLCLDQGIPLDPQRIQHAVKLCLGEEARHPAPASASPSAASDSETPWIPDNLGPDVSSWSKIQWQAHRHALAQAHEAEERVRVRWAFTLVPVNLLAMIGGAYPCFPATAALLSGSIAAGLEALLAFSLGASAFVVTTVVSGLLLNSVLRRRKAYRAACAQAESMTGCDHLESAAQALNPCTPSPARLRRWLACPIVADHLKRRVCHEVPLLNLDADLFDTWVAQSETQLDRAQAPWAQWLTHQGLPAVTS